MKIMRSRIHIFIHFILLFSGNIFAQVGEIRAKDICEAISESPSGYRSDGRGEWLAANDDSAYYRMDTLIFQHPWGGRSHGCNFVQWRFCKSHHVTINFPFYCVEPPAVYCSDRDNHQYQLKKRNGKYIISLFLDNSIAKQFQVLRFEKYELAPYWKIILLRIF